MEKWSRRLGAGLFFAFLLFVVSTTIVQASEPGQDPTPDPSKTNCSTCHGDVYAIWEQSAHGQGLSCGECHLTDEEEHIRQGHATLGDLQNCMDCHTTGYNEETDTWEEDNVHCTACHSPAPDNHPFDDVMPTNRSEELCGQCHIQAHFEWQTSKHGAVGVACVSCHNQHATGLRAEDVSEQCANCHGSRVEGFSHSEHSGEGLTCADCHLTPLEGPVSEGSAKRDHSFHVEVTVCTSCHAYQLHDGAETPEAEVSIPLSPPGELDSMASTITEGVCAEPASVNPLGLAAATGLASLVVGLIVAPWARQQFNRKNGKGR